MSGMTSNSREAPQESLSMASVPATSPAAGGNTKVTASKPSQDIKFGFSSSLSLWEKVSRQNSAAQTHFAARAEERKKKKEEERQEIEEKNKIRKAKLRENKQANLLAALKYSSDSAKKKREAAKLQRESSEKQSLANQKKSKSTSKEMGQKKTEPNKNRVKKSNAPTTPKQRKLPNAESDSASNRTLPTSHDASSSPVLAPASAPADGFNKHGKRSLEEKNDEQVTSELSNGHRSKRARSQEPYISPRKKIAHVASRRRSLGANAMPSSTYNSVTGYSATVNGGFVPPAIGDMIPFGADGHAGLKYRHYREQRSKESHAKSKEQGSTKQVQKRAASEPLPEPMAKKSKQFDQQTALLREAEPATKEEAESKNDEDNKPSSNSAEDSSNDEEKMAEKISKTDTASTNTSTPQNDQQDATQGDNKTSQTSKEKRAESWSNQTVKSTPKTQDGQTSANKTAPTTTSGSTTETTTQQSTAQKSKKNNAQDQVAEVSKKTSKNSDNTDTEDEAHSATEKPAKTKPATKATSKPQRKAQVNDDQDTTTSKQSAARPASSAPDVKKSTSKGSAVKQPLADTTNTNRQPTKLGSKKAPGSRTKEQPEAAEKRPTQAKSAASKKRKHDGDGAVESNPEPATKKQHKEQSKKRSRVDNEDEGDVDDAGSVKKNTKKQRTKLSSTATSSQPIPDVSTSFNPDRASRSSAAAAKKRAADAARSQVPRPQNSSLWVDFDDEDQFKPRDEAQTQASGTVNEDEHTEDEQTSGDDAEHEVEDDGTPIDARHAEDAAASNGDKPQPQMMKKKKGLAQPMGEEQQKKKEEKERKKKKKKKAAAPARPMSAAARHRKVGRTLFLDR